MRILRRYLKQHELTQEDFADRVGVTQGQVSAWLSGKKRPSLDNLLSITRVTGISIAELIADLQKQVA